MKFIVAFIALAMGGWMTFDGTRAFVVGDYVTPKSGPNAGQLGPRSHLLSSIGIAPRGNVAKSLHVVLGTLWLLGLLAFLIRPKVGWYVLAGSSVLSLWYVPLGTVLSVVELCLLFLPQMKSLR